MKPPARVRNCVIQLLVWTVEGEVYVCNGDFAIEMTEHFPGDFGRGS